MKRKRVLRTGERDTAPPSHTVRSSPLLQKTPTNNHNIYAEDLMWTQAGLVSPYVQALAHVNLFKYVRSPQCSW